MAQPRESFLACRSAITKSFLANRPRRQQKTTMVSSRRRTSLQVYPGSEMNAVNQRATSNCPFMRYPGGVPQEAPEYKHKGFLENFELVSGDLFDFYNKQFHGRPVVKGHCGMSEAYLVGSGALAREAFTKPDIYTSGLHPLIEILGPDQLIFQGGEKHSRLRQLIAPTFAPDAIEKYIPVVQELAMKHLNLMADQSTASSNMEGVPAFKNLSDFTFEVITRVVGGMKLSDEELKHCVAFYRDINTAMIAHIALPLPKLIENLPFLPGGKGDSAKKWLISRYMAEINRARACLQNGESLAGQGMLGELVEAGSEEYLTDEQLADTMIGFNLAGHETSATLMASMLHYISKYPKHWKPVVAEQQQIMNEHGEELTPKSLKMMTLTTNFINEALRLHSPAPVVFRTATQDTVLAGYRIPEGSTVVMPLQYMSMTEPTWANETGELSLKAFNPDRYVGLNKATPGLMPFGYGNHRCPGQPLAVMESKIVLALLARGFKVQVVEEPKWQVGFVLHPTNGLPVMLTRMNTALNSQHT